MKAIVPSALPSNSKCPDLGRRAIWPPDHRDHWQKRHSIVTDCRSTVESMKRRLRNPGHQNKLHQESGGRGGKRCFAFVSFLLTATSTTINTGLQLRGVQVEPHNTPLNKRRASLFTLKARKSQKRHYGVRKPRSDFKQRRKYPGPSMFSPNRYWSRHPSKSKKRNSERRRRVQPCWRFVVPSRKKKE